jgi:hypothetical protein
LSTLLEDGSDSRGGGGRLVLLMRVVAALSALAALASLWSVERAQVKHDLQLAIEQQARPGELLAVRALLFRDVDAPEGPTLVGAPTSIRLLDDKGRELVRGALRASALTTLDGVLPLPGALAGAFVVEARARYEGHELVCRRALRIASDAQAGRLRGREAGPLQQLSVGRVVPKGAAPAQLAPRVLGGACVPDRRCDLLVWMGEPAAALGLRSNASVEILEPPSPAAETSGLVALALRVRGLDAELTLVARRAQEVVAERALRLPIGLGEVSLHTRESLVTKESALRYEPPPGREQLIVDLFAAQRWRASAVLPASSGAFAVRALQPPVGLVRVQARADRFSGEGAGARVLYLRAAGESDEAALRAIAQQVAHTPGVDAKESAAWAQVLPPFARDDVQRTAAFALAPLEQLRLPVPIPVSGRPAQLRALSRTRTVMRFGVAGALVVSALVMALSLARRGLSAASEAEAILREARGDEGLPVRGERLRARANVLLLVLAVVSAFLAAALLIAAKPLWF